MFIVFAGGFACQVQVKQPESEPEEEEEEPVRPASPFALFGRKTAKPVSVAASVPVKRSRLVYASSYGTLQCKVQQLKGLASTMCPGGSTYLLCTYMDMHQQCCFCERC